MESENNKPEIESSLLDLVDRRSFLKLSGKGIGFAALTSHLAACGGGDPLEDETDPDPEVPTITLPDSGDAYHFLSRTSFGVTAPSLATVQEMGIPGYLDQQLDYENIDVTDLESEITSRFPLTQQGANELLAGFPDNIAAVAQQMVAATQYRQMFSGRQLYEVMVAFWTNHFNIHLVNGLGPTLKPSDDLNVIRQHALGNFRDLLFASAKSPAMLFYLDNFYNKLEAPNENYARELMELHTLGVDGGYTEQDIKEVARCFTGWSLTFPNGDAAFGEYIFYPAFHDTGAKQVMELSIAAGGGETDGEQVLDYLASHPSTAQFIATKLCRHFISDQPDSGTIDTVAAAFTAENGDVKATLRALFSTSAFLSSGDDKFSMPSEYLSRLIRVLNRHQTYPSDQGQLFYFAQSLLGQLPFNWPTPDGYPDTQNYWANTGALLNRWRFSFFSFANEIASLQVFSIDWTELAGDAANLGELLDNLVQNVLCRTLLDEDRQAMIDWITSKVPITEETPLTSDLIQGLSALMTAALISSVYFQMR